jgi:hypothetical protein
MSKKQVPADPAVVKSLHVLGTVLGDLVEAVTEAEALAARGDQYASIALLEPIELRLQDALILQRGILVLHRQR